jgi:hypothetical protein
MRPQHLQKRQDWIRGRREKRKMARYARLRRQVLRYSLLLVLVVVGTFGFTRLPCAISSTQTDIAIHGNQVVSDDQVREVLQCAVGKSLFKLDPQALEERVSALPAVKYAFVRRYILPRPQLRVEVLEEFPWASYCLTPDGPVEGVVAQTGRMIPLSQFPKVVQPPLRLCINKNTKLSPAQIADWDRWVRLLASQTGQPVSLVDLRNITAIVAYSGPLELRLGAADSTLTRRAGRLASVMPVAEKLKEKLKYINLALDSNIPLKVDKSEKAGPGADLLLEAAQPGTRNGASGSAPGSAPPTDTAPVQPAVPEQQATAAGPTL